MSGNEVVLCNIKGNITSYCRISASDIPWTSSLGGIFESAANCIKHLIKLPPHVWGRELDGLLGLSPSGRGLSRGYFTLKYAMKSCLAASLPRQLLVPLKPAQMARSRLKWPCRNE